jgi:hypothetical protein
MRRTPVAGAEQIPLDAGGVHLLVSAPDKDDRRFPGRRTSTLSTEDRLPSAPVNRRGGYA